AAMDHLRRVVAEAPALAPARLQLGLALQEMGDVDGAVAELREAARLDPSSADAANSLGLALMRSGAADEAGATLRALLPRAPHDETPRPNPGSGPPQKADLRGPIA